MGSQKQTSQHRRMDRLKQRMDRLKRRMDRLKRRMDRLKRKTAGSSGRVFLPSEKPGNLARERSLVRSQLVGWAGG